MCPVQLVHWQTREQIAKIIPVSYVVVVIATPALNLYSYPVRTARITPLVNLPFVMS
jgi:hypothetical protein